MCQHGCPGGSHGREHRGDGIGRAAATAAPPAARLPFGRRIELPDRGHHLRAPGRRARPVRPTLLLLHGWVASAGLNWFQAFEPLRDHFNIVAPDLRGHARGLRTRKIFRLADCADDCAATLEELGTGPVIAVGYSMGGPVAQLLWRRHRDLVDGLVLCATSADFMPNRLTRNVYQAAMLSATAMARARVADAAAPAGTDGEPARRRRCRPGPRPRCAATTGA